MTSRPIYQLLIGLLIGVASSLSISLGLVASVAAIVLLTAIGFTLQRFWFLAGALTGLGGSWFVLTLSSVNACLATEDFCGQATFVPFTAVSLALVGIGILLAALTIARGRQARAS